jgi:hypothetical protein
VDVGCPVDAPDALDAAAGAFIRSLQRNMDAAEPYADQAHSLHPLDVAILERAQALIGRLLHQAARAPSRRSTRKGLGKSAS